MTLRSEDILGDCGPIASRLGSSFEARPEQLEMAREVGRALEDRATLLVEAGTGVGKSFAYLTPAIQQCLGRGEVVVVATHTIALQEQLVQKDVPLLQSTLGERDEDAGWGGWEGELRAELVKGRNNYLSIRRLEQASKRQERLFPDPAMRQSLHVIEDWAYATEDGTRSTLPVLERPAVWDQVQSDSGNCMGRKCPRYQVCFYQNARRRMERANLLICNHAIFFADLALRTQGVGLLPDYQHVILDEAHNVEDVAAEHFGISLSRGRVLHLLNMLYHPRTQKGYLAHLLVQSAGGEDVEKAVALSLQARDAATRLFDDVAEMVGADGSGSVRDGGRMREPGLVANELTPVMRELSLRLRSLRENSENEADRFELASYAVRAGQISGEAKALVDQDLEDCVYWAEVQGREQHRGRAGAWRATLACAPVEVSAALKKHLFERDIGIVLTSATLTTAQVDADAPLERMETAFAHVMGRLGCEGSRVLQLGSPFDYRGQVELHIEKGMPDPRGGVTAGRRGGGGEMTFTDALTEKILRHVVETDGGAFVLFTSFQTLGRVADRLERELEAAGLTMLVQGRDGSRSQILARFRDNPRSVLLGAATFWQGVDVQGTALRNVIITRLPFDPPERPLTAARLERIEARGGNAFFEESVPRAILRFKQGFGRLIRSHSDAGRVVVLDPRIVTKGYGRAFLRALPDGIRVVKHD